MARGRMINSKIASDSKINRLSDDTSRLAFTWLITFADANGRTYGDPAMVRSLIFPRRSDVTAEQIEAYIREWYELGMIDWYEAEDDKWIEFVNFAQNQPGLRYDREPDSGIPANTSGNRPAIVRQSSGEVTDNFLLKLSEVKLTEEKLSEEKSDNLPGVIVPLMEEFTRQTNITELNFSRNDFSALSDMQKAGVTPDDLRNAVQILRDKDYSISGPSSVKRTAISEMSKRTRNGKAPPGGVGKPIQISGPGVAS